MTQVIAEIKLTHGPWPQYLLSSCDGIILSRVIVPRRPGKMRLRKGYRCGKYQLDPAVNRSFERDPVLLIFHPIEHFHQAPPHHWLQGGVYLPLVPRHAQTERPKILHKNNSKLTAAFALSQGLYDFVPGGRYGDKHALKTGGDSVRLEAGYIRLRPISDEELCR